MESEIRGKTQLIVYAQPRSSHYGIVQLSAVQSGILTEFFAPGYDRYFLSLRSPRAWPGWAAFDGRKLRQLREAQVDDMLQYRGVVESDLIFYVPQISIPRILNRIVVVLKILQLSLPLAVQQVRKAWGRRRSSAETREFIGTHGVPC